MVAAANLDSLSPVRPVLLAGIVAPLGDDGRTSGIGKLPVEGPWTITPTGLLGDEQADLESHGGVEKSLHHYPLDHYAAWRREVGAHPLLENAGAFGENVSTVGWTEHNVHVGDVIAFGAVVLQVSQGRQPCWKLNVRFARKTMAREVQTTGRTGWYYRVLEPGVVQSGEPLRLIERPCPDWPLQRMTEVLYTRVDDVEALSEMAEMRCLSDTWRVLARRRLASRKVEDWTRRLEGASAR